jgi:outer membrane protein
MTFPLSPRRALTLVRTVPLAAALLSPRPASALQPVATFLEHAATWNPDNRAARAISAERDSEVTVSTGSLLPSFTASADYTRNQYEITAKDLFPVALPTGTPAQIVTTIDSLSQTVITPQNQVDASLAITVPLLNIASWDRRSAAKHRLAAGNAEEATTRLVVAKGVLRVYYQLVGLEALSEAATKSLEISRNNLKIARDKDANGTGSELDVQRAVADEARAQHAVTAAELEVVDLRRDLYALSGIEAEPSGAFPEDDLHEEAPLATWLGGAHKMPQVEGARSTREAADAAARAAKTMWLPTVAAVAGERLSNATAFSAGHTATYVAQLVATIRLDTTIVAQTHAGSAAAAAARAAEDKARQASEDAIYKDWQQIRADVAQARSARAQVGATQLAAKLAEQRYENGVATQLDVLGARQDAFEADVVRIQADADLAYARVALRIDSGSFRASSNER